MKLSRIFSSAAALCLLAMPQMVLAQSSIRAEFSTVVSAAGERCTDASDGLDGAAALIEGSPRVIVICKQSADELTAIADRLGPFSEWELSMYYFNMGGVYLSIAAMELMKNEGKFNETVCRNALNADQYLDRVTPVPGTSVDTLLRETAIAEMVIPPCKQAYGVAD